MENFSTFKIESLQYLDYQDISLEINPGEIISISGESGSGKSLFLRAIIDLIPSSGQIKFGGMLRNSTAAHIWREKVAYLPAESFWWGESVGEHISVMDLNLLKQLNFEPDIYEKLIHNLSTGEKQRLAFLRVLHRQPDVFLLDEPTASLDPDNTQRIEALILEISKKKKLL